MNRLTENVGNGEYVFPSVRLNDVILKLGQLEDIEELCEKIVEKPIYMKYRDTGEIAEQDYTDCTAAYRFDTKTIELHYAETGDFDMYFELAEYGKEWALTKEELE